MSKLGAVVEAVEKHERFVLGRSETRARVTRNLRDEVNERWEKIKADIPVLAAPTGLPLPRLALPEIDEPGEIARYLLGDGFAGRVPVFEWRLSRDVSRAVSARSRRAVTAIRNRLTDRTGVSRTRAKATVSKTKSLPPEEPTRLFSGLMLAEDTNKRFHFLSAHQRSKRLSTAFDGPTLYGIDSDADGVFGKIGEGGVAVDTVEDMVRLYDGFELGAPNFSASMTISGPAPIIMAMYIAAAKRRFGPKVVPNLRGTIQADIFKEVQAQNETIFPTEASLRFLCST